MARYEDPMVAIERAQALSGERYRRMAGITNPPPKPPDPATTIATEPFFAHVNLRVCWPPPDAAGIPPLSKETLAVVAESAVPGLAERLGLKSEELYKDPAAEGALSIILGPASIVAANNLASYLYRPAKYYLISEAVAWTKRFSAEIVRRDIVEMRRAAAEAEREETRQREALRQARAKAEEQKIKDSLIANDPRTKVKELEARVADMERREKEAAARRVAALEAALEARSKLPPG
jgi:hypothetical protein